MGARDGSTVSPHPVSPPPLAVEFHGVTLGYDRIAAVENASLTLRQGAFAGIVGPSGAGKTTLLRAMLGGVPRVQGRVCVLGQEVRPGRPGPGIGYVPQLQTVDWNFPVTVDEVVLLGRAMHSGPWPWPRRTDRREVSRVLDRLGIGSLGRRHIRELSGGQQQRVFLARALVAGPRILLLDEPTSGIDIKTRDEVLHLLSELNADGVTIVLTTHELNAVAAHLPEVICVNRAIIACGPPDEVFTPDVLLRTYGAEMQVVRQDGFLLVADAAPHGLRDLLHRHGADDPLHRHPLAGIGSREQGTGRQV